MSSPAYRLAQHLATAGVGTFGGTSGWAIAVSREPLKPVKAITLYDTPGGAPALFDEGLRDQNIQVRVRAKDYLEAYDKQQEVFAVLNAIIDQDVGGDHYLGVWLQTDINNIGRDDNDRQLLTANYRIERGV